MFAWHRHQCLGTEGFISRSYGSKDAWQRAQGDYCRSGGGRQQAQGDYAEAEAVQRALRYDAL
jgi:hypothetical protein